MNRFALTCLASVAALAVLAGCGGSTLLNNPNPSPTPTPAPSATPIPTGTEVPQPGWSVSRAATVQPVKKWTFLVYMNGANDLEQYGILNLNQMEKIGSTADVNMVVQFKRRRGLYDSSNGDWSDTRRFYVYRGTDNAIIESPVISQRDDCDMGRPGTLQEFIQWGVAAFPAERYCLVVWNHGAGWRSVKTPGATRGVSYDDATNHHIETIELPAAIDLGGGRKWDILAFDASLMQMVEVAYEIRDKTNLIVGSEESPPGEGYVYDKFLGPLTQNPDQSTEIFARSIVQTTLDSYGASSNITQSVLDAGKVAPIVSALNTLGGALMTAKTEWGSEIAFARESAESYSNPDYYENKDLLDFLRRLTGVPADNTLRQITDGSILLAAQTVRTRLGEAILFNRNGAQHPNSNGLAAFIPSPFRYSRIDVDQANGFGQRYSALKIARDAPGWQTFLANGPR